MTLCYISGAAPSSAAGREGQGEGDDLEVVAMDEDDGQDQGAESLGDEEESDGG